MVLSQVGTGMVRAVDQLFGAPDTRRLAMARLNAAASSVAAQRDLHYLLDAYVQNNSLYDWVAVNRYESDVRDESMKGIRTPFARIVDFYVSHLWPGDLDDAFPIETENPSIIEPIKEMWEWSNWTAQKDVAAEGFATYGDMIARINTAEDGSQAYFELIRPHDVSDFEDDRGHLKMIRLDIPLKRTVGTLDEWYTHVEVWSKAEQSCRIWEHQYGLDAPLEDLGRPDVEIPFAELGIDFVPFVRAPFRQRLGEQWGMGCFTHLLDKGDELNRKATRHAELMFLNINTTWQTVTDLAAGTGNSLPPSITAADFTTLTLGDQRLLNNPPGVRVETLVPNLQYEAYLKTLESEEKALAADAPEMLWTRLSESPDLSGRALGYLLAPAVKRVERARGSAERALIRLAMMGLTIGKNMGLFPGLQGTYDAGSFQHTFKKRDVLPKDLLDEATTLKTRMDARLSQIEMLKAAPPIVLEEEGYSEQEIERIEDERREAAEEGAEQLARAMTRPPALPSGRAAIREAQE